jgi:AcrR family transcriptional regulator
LPIKPDRLATDLTHWSNVVYFAGVDITRSLEVDPTDVRLVPALDAAVAVFARFGFRKTSMDEVARAAGVSRQGLYLQFANKEELFRKALVHTLSQQLKAAVAALGQVDDGLEHRLIAACEAWSGRFVGSLGSDAADLMCAGTSLAGSTLSDYETQFESAVTDAIVNSPLAVVCGLAGLRPADVARALHATARGLKHSSTSREEFLKGITAAARMVCVPLNPRLQRGIADG